MDWPHEVIPLPGGARLVLAPAAESFGTSMGLYFASGSRHEPARLNGVSHFIEHLMFKGTRRRSARDIAEAIEGCGGISDAYTQEDMTCYFARVPADRQLEILGVMLDMVQHPRFDPGDLARERQVILEEIAMYHDQPAHRAEDLLLESLWPAHPLGRPITGTEASLKRMTRADIVAFWRKHYQPANLVVALAGRIDKPAILRLLERSFRGASRAQIPAGRRARVARPPRRCVVEGRDTDQCQLHLGFKCFGRHHPQRYALRLLSVLAGETSSSRLFQRIREDRGWAYSISSQTHLLSDTGYFGVEAGLDASRVKATLRLVSHEFRDLAKRGPRVAELQRAKDFVIGQLKLGLETPANRLGWVGEQTVFYDRILSPSRVIQQIESVTCSDVREVASSVFKARTSSLVIVGPRDDQGAFSDSGAIISSLG